MTMVGTCSSHTIFQKSGMVAGRGPVGAGQGVGQEVTAQPKPQASEYSQLHVHSTTRTLGRYVGLLLHVALKMKQKHIYTLFYKHTYNMYVHVYMFTSR